MKKIIALSLFCLSMIACGDSAVPPAPKPSEIVSAHSQPTPPAPPSSATNTQGKTKWTQSGDPIDVSKFDAEIEKAEKALKNNADDQKLKNALSEAYFKRGFALTEARQYASALGDYRRAVKLNPDNAEAQEWIKKIVAIYNGLNKSYPNEGEEPPPLPFDKNAANTNTKS